MSRRVVSVVAAGPEHGSALAALFERTGSPCHCRWWHFGGDKNAWLDRCANSVDTNRQEMLAALARGSDEMRGVVALDENGDVVGWMKLAPVAAVKKIYDQRLYKGLPCLNGDRDGVLAVGCFLVDEDFRGHGVGHALLEGAVQIARRSGARAIEAFPRVADGVSGEHLWTGPLGIFEKAGFRAASELAQYPLMRLDLDAPEGAG